MSEGNPVSELLRIVSRLTALLERETEMLRAMKPSEIEPLQRDKMALSADYGARIKALKADPKILRSISTELRADFEARVERFRAALSANERGLRAARETTERALGAIAEEVQAKTRMHAGYSAKGASGVSGEAHRISALSFAYDQRL